MYKIRISSQMNNVICSHISINPMILMELSDYGCAHQSEERKQSMPLKGRIDSDWVKWLRKAMLNLITCDKHAGQTGLDKWRQNKSKHPTHF